MKKKEVKQLSKAESNKLVKILDAFEKTFGGGVEVDMFNYDNKAVDIQAVYLDDEGQTEEFSLERRFLSDETPVNEIAESID